MGKIKQRKYYAWIMSVIIFIGLLTMPALPAYANTNEVETHVEEYNASIYDSYEEAHAEVAEITAQNIAADMTDNYLNDNGEVVDVPTFTNIELASEFVRKCMVERRSSVKFIYKVGTYNTKAQFKKLGDNTSNKIFDKVFEETSNANEGDYLRWNWVDASGDYKGNLGTDYITFNWKMEYLTTAAQERSIDKKINAILNDDLDKWEIHTDAHNAWEIYRWLILNMVFDDKINDISVYSALTKGKTSEYGMSILAYRLCKEMGIDNRVVTSETHCWNLVAIKTKYYNFDASIGYYTYNRVYNDWGFAEKFFLFAKQNFHWTDDKKYSEETYIRSPEYNTKEFLYEHYISPYDYVMSEEDDKTFSVPKVDIIYATHIQSYGWQDDKKNGETSGTSGEAKRLEAIEIEIGKNSKLNLGVEYKTHIQSYGWEPTWKKDGVASGTSGEGKRLEAIKIRLTGRDAARYDVYYRVHAQSYGWLGWAKNGESAGTAGQGKRLEAIQIKVVKKGTKVSGRIGYSYIEYGKVAEENTNVSGLVNYSTHVQTYGWQGYVHDGSLSGTYGEGKRLEGIKIKLGNTGVSGSIQYRTHVQSYGWMSWKKDGAMSGTSGKAKRLEAIQIKLTGNMAKKYDVYYRVHAQTYGWLGWVKNGKSAGTQGQGKRLEAIQIVIVPKGEGAPGSSTMPGFIQ